MITEANSNQKTPRKRSPNGHKECIATAWRLLNEGVHSYRAIARAVNMQHGCDHTHGWAKSAIEKHSRILGRAIDNQAMDYRAKYISTLQTIYSHLAQIASESSNDNVRVRALHEMGEIEERIAAAMGVVTKREGREITGARVVQVHIVPAEETEATGANGDGHSSP